MAITTADGEKVHVTVDEAAEGLEMPVGAAVGGDGENGQEEERVDRRAATNAFYFYQGTFLNNLLVISSLSKMYRASVLCA